MKVSFEKRGKLQRILARFSHKRRDSHLRSRIFQANKRICNLLSTRQKVWLCLSVIFLGGVIGFGGFSGYFDVEKVAVERSSLDLPLGDIELSVRELALGKNILTLDTSVLRQAVRELRPDISQVKIKKHYPREIVVEVFKFPIVAELRDGDEKIYLNEKGYHVLGDTPDRDTLMLTLGEELDTSDTKEKIIEDDYLATMRDAAFYFEALTDMKVLSVKYFPISREAHLKSESNFDVWLDLTQDYRTQLNKLAEAADILILHEKKYDYLDLRIRGKIFYKPR